MKLLNRLLAWTLALAMTAAVLPAPAALAEELPEAEIQSAGLETEASAESEVSVEVPDGTEEAEASVEEEALLRGKLPAAGTVTGFGDLKVKEIAMAERYDLKVLLAKMPRTLPVHLDGSEELVQLPVSWYCPGGYEGSNDFYFQFSPSWDQRDYPVAEGIDVERDAPYIAVYVAEPSELSGISSFASGTRSVSQNNADAVFAYLTENMQLNSAAACGVMANMCAESAMNPKCKYLDTNGKISYGLCQWNGSRFTSLKKWCASNGCDYQTVSGQMRYLDYELNASYKKVLNYLYNVKDSASGSYDAAYYWCYYYEIPASRERRSKERGNLAKNTYWNAYGGSAALQSNSPEPVLTGASLPEQITEYGSYFTLKGTIRCSTPLTEVTAGVYKADGTCVTGKTAAPNANTFDVYELDEDVLFSQTPAGTYTYRITAVSGGKRYTLLEQGFTVAPRSLSDAAVTLSGSVPWTGKALKPAPKVVYGKTVLKSGTDYKLTYQNNTNPGTGTCIITGIGNYAGQVKKPFKITSADSAPVLTKAAMPKKSMEYGSYFTLSGTITSAARLTSVSAGIYDGAGTCVTGATAKPNAKTFDVYQLDEDVLFSKTPVGSYTYRITAVVNGSTYTLAEQKFTVTPKRVAAVKLSTPAAKTVTVKWSRSAGAAGYQVQYGRKSNFSDAKRVTVPGAKKLSRTLNKLASKKHYYVRVRSYGKDSGGKTVYSAYSKAVKVKTK